MWASYQNYDIMFQKVFNKIILCCKISIFNLWDNVWWNTYTTSLNPWYMLQKKVVRIITFSRFYQHSIHYSSVLTLYSFLTLSLFIFHYLCINVIITYFPTIFLNFFISVNKIHKYNTRFAAKQSYYLPKVRTNYGIFNIFNISRHTSCSVALFKFKLKQSFSEFY